MALFSPDQVPFGDDIGFGVWLNGHYLEHQQFVRLGLQASPPRPIADYDLLAYPYKPGLARRMWLDSHQRVHDTLRLITGVQGFDLSAVDFDNEVSFAIWLDAHAQEHKLLRTAFGVI